VRTGDNGALGILSCCLSPKLGLRAAEKGKAWAQVGGSRLLTAHAGTLSSVADCQKPNRKLSMHIEGYFDGSEELRPGSDREEILNAPEGQAALVLAAHLIENEFTYDGIGEAQAVMLDEFARTVCSPEAVGDYLHVKGHSPGPYVGQLQILELLDRLGYVPSPLSRLLKRLRTAPPQNGEPRYLPMLVTGRRFGAEEQLKSPGFCGYAIFSPAEVVELREEVVTAINAPAPWKDASRQPKETDEYFLVPLTQVINSGRWMYMSYN
jgi:hypothetical protein